MGDDQQVMMCKIREVTDTGRAELGGCEEYKQDVNGPGQYQLAFLAVKEERKGRRMDQSSSNSDSFLDNPFFLPLSLGQ